MKPPCPSSATSTATSLLSTFRTSLSRNSNTANLLLRRPTTCFFTSTPPRRTPTKLNLKPGAQPDYSPLYNLRNTSLLYYTASLILSTLTLSYASVPLYRALCQRTGFGGTPILLDPSHLSTPDKLVPTPPASGRRIRVTFHSSVSDLLDWKFVPQQREVRVFPGETALAFYTATNRSNRDITGVATYSVTPGQVAPYFSKIQCFCFEEQRLEAGETVDMPVFFFVDPEFVKDPAMKGIEQVALSYTFFKSTSEDAMGPIRPLPVREKIPVVEGQEAVKEVEVQVQVQ